MTTFRSTSPDRVSHGVGGGAPARPTRRGFTLIEVLIAVIVLALGLLGLGAVFPVVVRAQRQSTEDTLGTAGVNSARAFLSAYDFRSAMRPWTIANRLDTRNFWAEWRRDPTVGLNHPSSGAGNLSADECGHWVVPGVDDDNILQMGVPANAGQGRPVSCEVRIPVRERLVPWGPEGDPTPQFVWDIAVHRSPDFNHLTDATKDDLEVAVFVRRLDPRIRPKNGQTIYQALTGERTGGVGANDRRRAVGVFATGPQIGLPTGDGTGKYAMPLRVDVQLRPVADPVMDRLYVLGVNDTDPRWLTVRQTGQKLVDNLGQIHTVRTWGTEGGARYVELEGAVGIMGSSSEMVQQVVFTPQVPASVFIHRIKP